MLEGPARHVLAIEIKRSSSPRPEKGFLNGCEDIRATERFFVIPAGEEHPIGHGTEAVPLAAMLERLSVLWAT